MVGAGRTASAEQVPVRPFLDPDPFRELTFPTPLAARRAIADEIRLPIGKLSEDDRQFIDALVARTLSRPEVIAAVRQRRRDGIADDGNADQRGAIEDGIVEPPGDRNIAMRVVTGDEAAHGAGGHCLEDQLPVQDEDAASVVGDAA